MSKAELELNEDLSFQEKFWAAERIAWAAFALFILLALLGFTGQGGVFARATAETAGVRLDYPRFSRLEASDDFSFRVRSATPKTEILLSERFLQVFELRAVDPKPAAETAAGNGVLLSFNVEPEKPVTISLRARAKRAALFGDPAEVAVNGESLSVRPTVIP